MVGVRGYPHRKKTGFSFWVSESWGSMTILIFRARDLTHTRREGGTAMAAKSKKTRRKEIHQALLHQVDPSGSSGQKHFLDLIDDYMKFWDIKEMLLEDIARRGVVVEYTSNAGITNRKKNESVDQLQRINAQMLKILTQLELKPVPEGEADEL